MKQEIVQKVEYRVTKRAKGYISGELGYDFGKTNPLDVIHALTWLMANGHPLKLKLEVESLKQDGPVNYEVDMSDDTKGNENLDVNYFYPDKRIDFGGLKKIPLTEADILGKGYTQIDEAFGSAEMPGGFDEPYLGLQAKGDSFGPKLSIRGSLNNRHEVIGSGTGIKRRF